MLVPRVPLKVSVGGRVEVGGLELDTDSDTLLDTDIGSVCVDPGVKLPELLLVWGSDCVAGTEFEIDSDELVDSDSGSDCVFPGVWLLLLLLVGGCVAVGGRELDAEINKELVVVMETVLVVPRVELSDTVGVGGGV